MSNMRYDEKVIFEPWDIAMNKTIRVKSNADDFSQQILAELVTENFSGKGLLLAFENRRKKIRPAVQEMLNEADWVAESTADYLSIANVLGEL